MSTPAEITVRLVGPGECDVVHGASGTRLRTSKSAQYGGLGRSFSSTELVAAALATCIATDLEGVAIRNDVALERIRIEAARTLATSPRRLAALFVRVRIEGEVDDTVLLKLRRAADACVVQRSLHPDVDVSIELLAGTDAS